MCDSVYITLTSHVCPLTPVDQRKKPATELLPTLQMDDQCLKAIFRDFFSQLRLLRPVAMLHLAGCSLTKTCALFLD